MNEVIELKNGVLKDPKTGRFVPGGKVTTAIASPSQAREMVARKMERKRERIEAGALAAVRERFPDKFTGEGDDWIEAVAEQITYKALDKLDPKQVDAARFLLQETGISEAKGQAQEGQGVTMHLDASAVQALAQWLGGERLDIITVIPSEQAGEADDDGEERETVGV